MGSYQEALDALQVKYQDELDAKYRDLEQFKRQIELTQLAIDDLEASIARLAGVGLDVKSNDETPGPVEKRIVPLTVGNVDRYINKRRTRSDWLAIIRREYPSGKEFSAQALAAAAGCTVDGAYTAAENLRRDGYLQRRGGRDDPSQHEVLWSLKQSRPEPFDSPH